MTAPYAGSPAEYAASTPNSVAFIQGATTVTWAEWERDAANLASALKRAGISESSRVGVRTGPRYEWFVVHAALSKLGAALVGVNRRATIEEIAFTLSDSAATAFVSDDDDPRPASALWRSLNSGPFICFQTLVDSLLFQDLVRETPTENLIASAPAQMIIYTSGTTGKPKGVFRPPELLGDRRQAINSYLTAYGRVLRRDSNSRTLLTHPTHHIAGVQTCLDVLSSGGSVVIQERFDPENTLRLIDRHRITAIMAVPTMLHRIRALPDSRLAVYDVSSMLSLELGGAAVPGSLKLWAARYFGAQCCVHEAYGASEIYMVSCTQRGDQETHPGSSGRVLPHVEVKIIDPDGRTLPIGETGEICAKTPLMIENYLNRPPLGPQELTPDGFYRTGDVGHLDRGGYLYVTDRIKDMIVSGGVNIYPAEIEAALLRHPAVLEAAVIGIPNEEFGEEILAFCELRSDRPTDPREIIESCRSILTSYKLPKALIAMPQLPRNESGKVTKATLREPYWVGRERRI